MPPWLSLSIIGISFLAMVQYFVVFPYFLGKTYGAKNSAPSIPSLPDTNFKL
jgi:hypothetical protein